MSSIVNPFLISGYVSPEYFCDRKAETQALMDSLRNGRNVTLRSPRRVGKTGLIKNVFHHIQAEDPAAACFYIDLFSTKSLSDFVETFGRSVIGKLDTPLQRAEGFITRFFKSCRLYMSQDPLSGQPQLGLDIVPTQSRLTLEEIFAYLRQSERTCFIAFDEFQQILEYPEGGVEALLRSYVQDSPNVHFVFSGSKQHLMQDLFTSPKRPFYRSTEKLGLEVLPQTTYYEFADEKMKQANVHLSEEVFAFIYDLTDGITWNVQYVLNKVYALRPEVVTEQIVRDCIADILESEDEDYRRLFNMLTLNQSQVLLAVARAGVVSAIVSKDFLRTNNLPAASSVKRAVDFLLDKEYLYHSEQGYVVYDRFFGLWLKRR